MHLFIEELMQFLEWRWKSHWKFSGWLIVENKRLTALTFFVIAVWRVQNKTHTLSTNIFHLWSQIMQWVLLFPLNWKSILYVSLFFLFHSFALFRRANRKKRDTISYEIVACTTGYYTKLMHFPYNFSWISFNGISLNERETMGKKQAAAGKSAEYWRLAAGFPKKTISMRKSFLSHFSFCFVVVVELKAQIQSVSFGVRLLSLFFSFRRL